MFIKHSNVLERIRTMKIRTQTKYCNEFPTLYQMHVCVRSPKHKVPIQFIPIMMLMPFFNSSVNTLLKWDRTRESRQNSIPWIDLFTLTMWSIDHTKINSSVINSSVFACSHLIAATPIWMKSLCFIHLLRAQQFFGHTHFKGSSDLCYAFRTDEKYSEGTIFSFCYWIIFARVFSTRSGIFFLNTWRIFTLFYLPDFTKIQCSAKNVSNVEIIVQLHELQFLRITISNDENTDRC